MASAWGSSFGAAWGNSWGTAGVVVVPPVAPLAPAGRGGSSGYEPTRIGRRIDYDERRRIADEFKALYSEIYAAAPEESTAADEAAALVASFVPTNAADFPAPDVVDWEAIVQDQTNLAMVLTALRGIAQALAIESARRAEIAAQFSDDEAAIAVLLTTI